MKKIKICLCILFIVGMFSGCSGNKIVYEDTYIPEQDFQYQHYDQRVFGVNTVETGDGYYKLLNQMIYYIDKDTMSVVPLCSKPDCLHDKERGEKRKECNAYINSEGGTIGYYRNHLYVISQEYGEDNKLNYGIYKISTDGVTKDKIHTIKEESSIPVWMVHRGYLYYSTKQEGRDEKSHVVIRRISLDNVSDTEDVYYMEDIYNGQTEYLGAYGNYVYFFDIGYNQDIESDLTDNYVKTLENRWYSYHIVTGEVKELFREQKENGELVKVAQYLTFWQNKILWCYFYLDEKKRDTEEGRQIWQCDLDGENYKEMWIKEDAYDKICSDGTYLYVYNFWRKSIENKKEKPKLIVYDQNMNQIDDMEMALEEAYTVDLVPGGNQCFFLDAKGEDKMQIFSIDKNSFGSYKGKAPTAKLLYETEIFKEEYSTQED